ncbi:CD1247 N-terminal domain-containing protein [Clostridium cylindrosporum]|uniref:Zinc ribbon domain-containing protein n=1 Tax=Clostridium cylindrosporum DSM 605 TaxID=1121307 RepID=A0A0J8DAK6_CLOCY|nr:CD1247 N-terminal domain-containing protein [Clostridium cylindrosporum]KMT21338.1 hypothetical protein CLCY_2c00980 [Clostridium cylindrosporum DSM 605]
MENLMKKAAYLKGLCDGLDISESTKEGKVLLAIVDMLEEMTQEIGEINELYEELDSYVESIDEAVLEIEEVLFEDEDHECDCGCHDEDGYVEIECPNCGDQIFLDEGMFEDEDEIICPNCDEPISFESSCGGCDCSCEETEE